MKTICLDAKCGRTLFCTKCKWMWDRTIVRLRMWLSNSMRLTFLCLFLFHSLSVCVCIYLFLFLFHSISLLVSLHHTVKPWCAYFDSLSLFAYSVFILFFFSFVCFGIVYTAHIFTLRCLVWSCSIFQPFIVHTDHFNLCKQIMYAMLNLKKTTTMPKLTERQTIIFSSLSSNFALL